MDALVAAIAQILDYIHTQGPDAIAQLTALLEALKVGSVYVAALFGLIAYNNKYFPNYLINVASVTPAKICGCFNTKKPSSLIKSPEQVTADRSS